MPEKKEECEEVRRSSGQNPLAGRCEHVNECGGWMNGEEFWANLAALL